MEIPILPEKKKQQRQSSFLYCGTDIAEPAVDAANTARLYATSGFLETHPLAQTCAAVRVHVSSFSQMKPNMKLLVNHP
ncbi:hypothetical protein F441_09785 [Phytophthora nicotianae CJ01A1]|uniref:Uncharacterized protein n=6 Tax=Phytophthora nicotianae TaxID=4792 RepID=W2R6J2_PHYN3|nr:hypothetical protein PPTG_21041 [Phytophthora nicotianae INRA-310]ETI45696.1 hypothetical protein F443_09837 [Phytophthora nicotianae P1569]ETL39040.1 hypothetical protein L916_09540 [Phytophthora nicotianae]ETO74303.1 hypothetical protein F444_09931 [Phytophthora nicotianae P1976]ETP15471.1 hypothetical protein F441_09785 [Phytophthora nicotianae CJ01A1]ETP43543.1 hypothetical protein F442_09741 [Phytophthora nicotianae P10297]